jgi:hypothetical protein
MVLSPKYGEYMKEGIRKRIEGGDVEGMMHGMHEAYTYI